MGKGDLPDPKIQERGGGFPVRVIGIFGII